MARARNKNNFAIQCILHAYYASVSLLQNQEKENSLNLLLFLNNKLFARILIE